MRVFPRGGVNEKTWVGTGCIVRKGSVSLLSRLLELINR